MTDQNKTRPEFDAIVTGWGSDDLEDLGARVELVLEFWESHLPLTRAEHKIVGAISERYVKLGGLELPAIPSIH